MVGYKLVCRRAAACAYVGGLFQQGDLRLLADNIYPNAQPQITDIDGTKVLIYTADNTERTAENRQMLVYSVYNEETGTWSAPRPCVR